VNYWYFFAALLAGWLTFNLSALFASELLAALAGFNFACLIALAGVLRDELPKLSSRRR